jgi:hypothetical protein
MTTLVSSRSKTIGLGLALALLAAHNSAVFAQNTTVDLAVEVDEGTKIEIQASEVADLRRWAETAKTKVDILQDDIRYLKLAEKRQALVEGIQNIIGNSNGKESDLLMVYFLRRALKIDEAVGPTQLESELQSVVSMLETSAQKSKDYYTDDQSYLTAIGQNEKPKGLKLMPIFGLEYFDYIQNLAPTFLNPKVEYKITRTALGWYGNDLNSNRNALDRPLFSEEIIRISELLKKYPANPPVGQQELKSAIRNLKYQIRERILPSVKSKTAEVAKKAGQSLSSLALATQVPSSAPNKKSGPEYDREVLTTCRSHTSNELNERLCVTMKSDPEVTKACHTSHSRDNEYWCLKGQYWPEYASACHKFSKNDLNELKCRDWKVKPFNAESCHLSSRTNDNEYWCFKDHKFKDGDTR